MTRTILTIAAAIFAIAAATPVHARPPGNDGWGNGPSINGIGYNGIGYNGALFNGGMFNGRAAQGAKIGGQMELKSITLPDGRVITR